MTDPVLADKFDRQIDDLMHTMREMGVQDLSFAGVKWKASSGIFSLKFHASGLREPPKPVFDLNKMCADAKKRLHTQIREDFRWLSREVASKFTGSIMDMQKRHDAYKWEAYREFDSAARWYCHTTIDHLTWTYIYNRCPSMG